MSTTEAHRARWLGGLLAMVLVSLVLCSACGKQEVKPPPQVEIVTYTDFQCHNCADLYFNVEEELLQLYGDASNVSLEVRPINGLGDASLLAGEGALCAGDQGRFWEYSSALFTAWREFGQAAYSEEGLLDIAGALGLDMEAFSSCLESGAKEEEVDGNRIELVEAGENEIPIMFINGNRIAGIEPLQTYIDVIEGLLSP